MAQEAFGRYSHYYNALNNEKNYHDESLAIRRILNNAGLQNGSILEFGCGTGIHAKHLTGMGYSVHGVDLSHEMVASAEPVAGFSCQQGDIRTVAVNRKFDAVLALFHVLSYMTANVDVKSVFDNAALHLEKGGLFVCDFWYSPAVFHLRPETRLKRAELDGVNLVRFAEPIVCHNENLVEVHYTFFLNDRKNNEYHEFKELHRMRHFTLPEIQLYAERAGFKPLAFQDLLNGETPSENTWGVAAVFERI